MNIWVIKQDCCSEYVSAWASEAAAERETARLNAEYQARFGRDNYDWEEDTLNV
ncbi:hypothetical protein ACFQ71_02860 [Streptomyces sp. NPDC056534]|uniref:hypothetical protein n=1 Tax=Streptomyces sp. NPDC056534 TaxID=3345857 RepID=UPI0036AC8889